MVRVFPGAKILFVFRRTIFKDQRDEIATAVREYRQGDAYKVIRRLGGKSTDKGTGIPLKDSAGQPTVRTPEAQRQAMRQQFQTTLNQPRDVATAFNTIIGPCG